MGSSWSNAVAWSRKEKELKIVLMSVLTTEESMKAAVEEGVFPNEEGPWPLDHDRLKPVIKENVAKRYKLFTKSLLEDWDGQGRFGDRPIRAHLMRISDGIIFMVDGDDDFRMEETKRYINTFFEIEMPWNLRPFLVIVCQKDHGDHGGQVSDGDERLAEDFGLKDVKKEFPWKIVVCDSEASDSLAEGLMWLRDTIAHQKADREALAMIASGKAAITGNHCAALLQKMKHFLSPSLKPA